MRPSYGGIEDVKPPGAYWFDRLGGTGADVFQVVVEIIKDQGRYFVGFSALRSCAGDLLVYTASNPNLTKLTHVAIVNAGQ